MVCETSISFLMAYVSIVSVGYGFIQMWQGCCGMSHNACVIFDMWCVRGSGSTDELKSEECFLSVIDLAAYFSVEGLINSHRKHLSRPLKLNPPPKISY